MSKIVKGAVKLSKKPFSFLTPDAPAAPPIPEPPTIDEATKNRDVSDRLRRRRGVLANIFGGGSRSSEPTVGVKQLLGG